MGDNERDVEGELEEGRKGVGRETEGSGKEGVGREVEGVGG